MTKTRRDIREDLSKLVDTRVKNIMAGTTTLITERSRKVNKQRIAAQVARQYKEDCYDDI